VGTHAAITAVFTPTNPAVFLTSTSAAGTIKVAAPAYTADPQYISTSIPAGTLLISTPYTSGAPLVLAPMTLNAGATLYSTSANFANISVADTRPGNLSYTLSALASNLNKFGVATPGVNESISGENVGLTAITPDSTNVSPSTFLGGVAPGGSTLGQNLTGFDNTAATGVPSNDGGSLGLGGAAPHAVLHANSGLGTTVVHGLLSITAPTNTLDGTYNGTVTFTVIGS
jgi:hypothetical protein